MSSFSQPSQEHLLNLEPHTTRTLSFYGWNSKSSMWLWIQQLINSGTKQVTIYMSEFMQSHRNFVGAIQCNFNRNLPKQEFYVRVKKLPVFCSCSIGHANLPHLTESCFCVWCFMRHSVNWQCTSFPHKISLIWLHFQPIRLKTLINLEKKHATEWSS